MAIQGTINGEFVHANFNFQSQLPILSTFSHAPPMSAIDRFLLGHIPSQNLTQLEPNPIQINPFIESLVGLDDFSSSSSSSISSVINVSSIENDRDNVNIIDSWLSMHENISNNRVVLDIGSPRSSYHPNNERSNGKISLGVQDKRTIGKSRRRKPSKVYVKGHWSEEEDSKLGELVHQHGECKWALISTKLFGRTGKQCRERWCNHLRPDIKKDSWSEEEEKMLVQAHMEFGNKWAEIARRIPGRTENSIKNYWNATIRKQFSKRKNKDPNNNTTIDNYKPSLLKRYIIFQHFGGYDIFHNNPNDDVATYSEADVSEPCNDDVDQPRPCMGSPCNYDEYDEFSPLAIIDPINHDELLFIKNNFPNNNLIPTCDRDGFSSVDSTRTTKVSFSPSNPSINCKLSSIESHDHEAESNFVASLLNDVGDQI